MVQQGLCKPSKRDYRKLNEITVLDHYSIPFLQDSTHFLHGKTVFSTIDSVRAYQQIPVRESDIPKTAIITPFGLFEFPYMTFGLRNAAQTFQRFMDQHGIAINPNKCVFGQKSVNFLGHVISAEGIKPLPEKVQAIVDFQESTTEKGLRRFLGILNFYNRFLKDIASIQTPLLKVISGRKHNNNAKIEWISELKQSFQRVKEHLAQATSLAFPNSKATLSLQTDASDKAIGVVLQQYSNRFLQPLNFFSRKLTPTQTKYSAYDRELLAIYMAIKHFRYMLEGRNFHVITNHKPFIQSGAENIVADALYRADTIVMPISLDMQEIAEAQASDDKLQQLKQSTSTRVFDMVHQMSHSSGRATHRQIAQKFVWPSMAKDIKEWTRTFERNRRPLDQPPHKVLERISDKVFAIEIDGKSNNVTVDRLKPAYVLIQDSETTPSTASPSSTNIPVQGEPKTYPSPATKRKTVSFIK
ncbi:POL2 protein, partial [Pseudoatta argentina]